MPLLSLQSVTVAFGGPPLLDAVNLTIDRGERVCLVGRNGSGKSTLMKVLDGTIVPLQGDVVRQNGVTVTRLDQEVPADIAGTAFDVVAGGLAEIGTLLSRYHHASHNVANDASEAALDELGRLHEALDASKAWQSHHRVETVLQHLGLDPEADFLRSSGGRKRQILLARALVREPSVLLLDEPTNHLDVAAIEWMERHLIDQGITLLFVTHDRAMLRRVATRIVELDRGRLHDWATDYDTYLERKEASLANEAREWELFDKKLAQEEVWIRTGIQARRTRNEGRVRALEALRAERAQRRERVGTVNLRADEAERSGRLVIEARNISFSHGRTPIVRDFTATILRGNRIGLVGPNGAGKTTLLRLLLGQLAPDSGTVRVGTNVEVAYFDQLREQLDPDKTVQQNIGDGSEFVEIGGVRKHIMGYLQDFLFSPQRARTPVRVLSGGERNRLLLARLFTQAFNLLVLDEPTNDLDIETLELLEALLLEYQGTLLLVSHDRAFLDNVVTSTFVFEGGGQIGEYVGGYSDWLRQRTAVALPVAGTAPRREVATSTATTRRKRITHKETMELAALPGRIDVLERERAAVVAALADPVTLRDGTGTAAAKKRLTKLDEESAILLRRWEELERLAGS
jgi:ATP-binding cassette subfamily F protein uup